MIQLEVTSVSSKGQIVIPTEIRKEMGLSEGTKLMVVTDGANLLLKPIFKPKIELFKKLIKESRRFARENGLTKDDLKKAIKKVRNESRT
jgi:AbrB family looped-hinge helix DNA binding protein